MNKKLVVTIAILAVLASGAYLVFHKNIARMQAHRREMVQKKRELEQRKRLLWQGLTRKVYNQARAFKQLSGIAIEDLSTGWRISINKDAKIPSASLAKLPIMASYGLASSQHKISLNEKITLTNKAKTNGSGILKALPAGSQFTIAQLLEIMITESDNTATNLLIDRLGIDYLNSAFKKLGLTRTNLARKMMDMKKRDRGIENYTSAADIALILKKAYQGKLINRAFSKKCMDILVKQKMRDRIPVRLPANIIVAHKTGLENGVCHDAGIVFAPEGNFLVVALVKHNFKTAQAAKKFIADIAYGTYHAYDML